MTKLQSDILERAGWTFVQAFLGFWAVGGVGGWKAALAAGAAAALSVIKGSAASYYGNKESASTVRSI